MEPWKEAEEPQHIMTVWANMTYYFYFFKANPRGNPSRPALCRCRASSKMWSWFLRRTATLHSVPTWTAVSTMITRRCTLFALRARGTIQRLPFLCAAIKMDYKGLRVSWWWPPPPPFVLSSSSILAIFISLSIQWGLPSRCLVSPSVYRQTDWGPLRPTVAVTNQ